MKNVEATAEKYMCNSPALYFSDGWLHMFRIGNHLLSSKAQLKKHPIRGLVCLRHRFLCGDHHEEHLPETFRMCSLLIGLPYFSANLEAFEGIPKAGKNSEDLC